MRSLTSSTSGHHPILLKKSPDTLWRVEADGKRTASPPRSGGGEALDREDLCHFPEVLGCGREVELVTGTIGTAQAQAV